MYIESISIENLKSISKLRWDLAGRRPEGWHVILGDNGSGKTSFLRGICLALLGPINADPLIPLWSSYVRNEQSSAICDVVVRRDLQFDKYLLDNAGEEMEGVLGEDTANVQTNIVTPKSDTIQWPFGIEIGKLTARPNAAYQKRRTGRNLSDNVKCWFSAAYGPFRRFTGGDREEEERLLSRPVVGRHMSVFAERVALSQPIEWLIGLHTEQLDTGKQSELLKDVIAFVNQDGFLPYGVRFDRVTSKDVLFTDAGGVTVRIEDLSDGYRSVLCMTLELIRQLSLSYGQVEIFDKNGAIIIAVPGVVLIDEVDVHLHPSWQRTIGLWYRKHFPKIQFIVTTHSPLVCQAADHGTVYSLPDPETGGEGGFVEGAMLDRLLYGNILEAYSTDLFGDAVTRSDASEEKLDRLASLNVKALRGRLTPSERAEREHLQRIFASSPSILEDDLRGAA